MGVFPIVHLKTSLQLFGLALLAAAPLSGHVSPIDASQSKMTVSVYKEGLFAFAADNHKVDVPAISGSFDAAARSVDVTVDATKMQVQDPPSRRDKVQANMMGPDVLDVSKYPTIVFRSTQIRVDDPSHWAVSGDLTLHGQTHPINFQVTQTSAMKYTGSVTIRQTTFGITPIKIAGGAVRVKDEVTVTFDIALK